MLRWLPYIIELALLVYCLIDCIQTDERRIRNLPRWAWLVLIVLIPIAGPIAWLIAGRGQGVLEATRPGSGPVGPDDDQAFLEGLSRDSERRRRDREITGDEAGDGAGDQPPSKP